jgi:transcriptional regulator with XRE-family HTH domain
MDREIRRCFFLTDESGRTSRGNPVNFGMKLERLLAYRGKNQREVARGLGVSPSTLHGWVSGRAQPILGPAASACDFLGADLRLMADDRVGWSQVRADIEARAAGLVAESAR